VKKTGIIKIVPQTDLSNNSFSTSIIFTSFPKQSTIPHFVFFPSPILILSLALLSYFKYTNLLSLLPFSPFLFWFFRFFFLSLFFWFVFQKDFCLALFFFGVLWILCIVEAILHWFRLFYSLFFFDSFLPRFFFFFFFFHVDVQNNTFLYSVSATPLFIYITFELFYEKIIIFVSKKPRKNKAKY
jgi:hypothetical protein